MEELEGLTPQEWWKDKLCIAKLSDGGEWNISFHKGCKTHHLGHLKTRLNKVPKSIVLRTAWRGSWEVGKSLRGQILWLDGQWKHKGVLCLAF